MTVATAAPVDHTRNPVAQARTLCRRALLDQSRQPQIVVPALFFPLFFTALNTAAFGRATGLPGFPEVDSFLDFLLPAAVLQAVIFGSVQAGTEMGRDIEDGFFDRLLAAPTSRVSILVGRLAGAFVLGVVEALVLTGVLWLFGASLAGGPLAVVVLALVAGLLGVGIGGFATALALRTGSAEAVQGSFPLVFVLLFTSSAFFPRELMNGWYAVLAGANPVSWLIEGLRELTIDHLAAVPALTAIAVAVGVNVVSISLSLVALRRRLRVVA